MSAKADTHGRATRVVAGAAATLLVALALAVAMLCAAGPVFAATQLPDTTISPSFPPGGLPQPKITSDAAILIDADTGAVLFSKNANERLAMASTTKIMTAILVLENLDLNKKVKVSAKAVAINGSKASLVQGEVLTVNDLFRAMMIISGNDAAIALAEATAGSVSNFVDMMNAKAKEMGLKNTHFTNPHGVNAPNHYSSARDLATLALYARKFPFFRQVVDTEGISLPTLPGQKPRHWDHNSNSLLLKLDWVNGIKTGSTPNSEFCLVGSGTQNGISVISVLLGAKTADLRWSETQALLEYGFSLHPRTVLTTRGQVALMVPLTDIMGRKVQLAATDSLTVPLAQGDAVTRSVTLDRDLSVPVKIGDAFGHMTFTLNGQVLGTVGLVAAQPVTRPTLDMIVYYWRAQSPLKLVLHRV